MSEVLGGPVPPSPETQTPQPLEFTAETGALNMGEIFSSTIDAGRTAINGFRRARLNRRIRSLDQTAQDAIEEAAFIDSLEDIAHQALPIDAATGDAEKKTTVKHTEPKDFPLDALSSGAKSRNRITEIRAGIPKTPAVKTPMVHELTRTMDPPTRRMRKLERSFARRLKEHEDAVGEQEWREGKIGMFNYRRNGLIRRGYRAITDDGDPYSRHQRRTQNRHEVRPKAKHNVRERAGRINQLRQGTLDGLTREQQRAVDRQAASLKKRDELADKLLNI